MAEYIERDEAIRKAIESCIKVVGHGITQIDAVDIAEMIDSIPAADVVEVRHRNPNDENCVICNSELDEKHAGGIWDLAGEICDIICPECDHDEQDTVYNLIRNYIETQNFCPKCGAKTGG